MNGAPFTLFEVAAAWAVVGALAFWLYRRSRQPLKRRVSTLRFWVSDDQVPPSRRKLREPLSLVAHLLFLLALILALADLHVGRRIESRRVAIIVDTSVWSHAHVAGQQSAIEKARAAAAEVIATLPPGDPVLLLRTDEDVTAASPFTIDRATTLRTLASLQPSSGVANLPRAIEAARAALSGSSRGLVVYVGPGLMDERQTARLADVRKNLAAANPSGAFQFLVRLVPGVAPGDNRGVTSLTLQRDPKHPEHWRVLTRIRNYAAAPAALTLTMSMNGYELQRRAVAVGANGTIDLRDDLTVSRTGVLEAAITPPDLLAVDDRARVAVPAFRPARVRIAVKQTGLANRLREAFSSNPYVRTERAGAGTSDAGTDVVVYEGTAVPDPLPANSIWFVSGTKADASGTLRVASWNLQHPATRWVRTRDVSVRKMAVLEPRPGDAVLASGAGAEPLVLARDQDGARALVIGFDPRDSNLQEQAAFPLLMAGAVEWMTRPIEETAGAVVAGSLDVAGPLTRVIAPSKTDVPFANAGRTTHFLALEPGVYRMLSGDSERLLPVNVAALPTEGWAPTPDELAPLASEPTPLEASALWRWLVGLGLVALWTEWQLFSYGK